MSGTTGLAALTLLVLVLVLVPAIGLLRPATASAAPDRRCSTVVRAARADCAWLARTARTTCRTGSPATRRRCYTRRGYARYHLHKLLLKRAASRAGRAVPTPRSATTAPSAPTHAPARPTPAPAVPPVASAPHPARSVAEFATDVALSVRGTPYVFGGALPKDGFDCSGLVQFAFVRAGRQLPRTTYEQFTAGTRVQAARRGDLVFSSAKGHVGIALGDGTYVNAPHTGTVVSITPLPTKVNGIVRIG